MCSRPAAARRAVLWRSAAPRSSRRCAKSTSSSRASTGTWPRPLCCGPAPFAIHAPPTVEIHNLSLPCCRPNVDCNPGFDFHRVLPSFTEFYRVLPSFAWLCLVFLVYSYQIQKFFNETKPRADFPPYTILLNEPGWCYFVLLFVVSVKLKSEILIIS